MSNILNCGGWLVDVSQPRVMGIINTTPDSFYEGSRADSTSAVLKMAEKHLEAGATFLDVGGLSSRPGATVVDIEEEQNRVLPAIKAIMKQFPAARVSVDTYHVDIARAALDAGACMINDISAFRLGVELPLLCRPYQAPYVLMHMQGDPSIMQHNPSYENVLIDVMDFLIERIQVLREQRVLDIIIDIGIGFGKTLSHNYELLSNAHVFQILECPMLIGLSRKSMIYNNLAIDASESLNGTTALHMVALDQGARILRVHDVKEAVETIKLWTSVQNAKNIIKPTSHEPK